MAEIASLIVKYGADTKDAEAGANRVNSSIGKVTKAGAALAVAGGALLGGFFAKSIMSAANFEQSMSGVAASLGGVDTAGGITTEQFQKLSDEALRIGATTSVGATDAARAMDLLGKAGISAQEIYSGVAQGVVNVAEATGESLDTSASAYGTLQNMFRDTGISSTQMSDTIVNAMNASDMSLSEFQTGIARLAPVISATGMSFQDSAAAIAYFNSIGFSAAEVGTSLTAAFNNLVSPTTDQAAAMEQLGIHAFDAQGAFIGFPDIMDQVAEATKGMTDAQVADTIATLFGADARDVMTEAAKKGGKPLRDYIKLMNQSGTAATASATRMNNLKGDIEGLKGALETLMIRVGTAFLPTLRNFVQGITGLITGLTDFGSEFIKMMNPAADFSQWLEKFPGWAQPVIKLMAGLYQATGDLVDAWQDFRRGDFSGALNELEEAARTAWDAVLDFAGTTLDWVLDTGVPRLIGWVVDNAGDVWSGIKSLAGWVWDGLVDLGGWTINVGIPGITGGITSIAGRAADWLKGYLLSGLSQTGDGTGGPDPFGTSGSLTATIGAWTINVGVPSVVGAITSIAGRLGDWLRGYLMGGSLSSIPVLGGIASAASGGIEVEIGTILLKVLDATTDLTADDVNGWLQKYIDAAGDFHATIKTWRLTVDSEPTVDGDPHGKAQTSLAKRILENIYMFSGLKWAVDTSTDPDIIFDPVRMIYAQLSKIVAGADITLDDLRWFARMGDPTVAFKTAMDWAKLIKSKLPSISVSDIKWAMKMADPTVTIPALIETIKAKIPPLAVTGVKWLLSLGIPDINIPSWDQIKGAIAVIAKDAGVPAAIVDRIFGGGQFAQGVTGGPGNAGSSPSLSGIVGEGTYVGGERVTTLPNTGAGPGGALSQVQGMATQIAQAMTQLANSVRTGVEQATAALNPLGAAFTATGARVNAATTQMSAQVRAQVTAMVAQVRAQFTQLQSTTAATMTAMQSQVNAQFTAMVSQGTAQVNALRAAVQSGMQAMAAAGNAAMAQFSNAVRSGFQQAVSAAQAGVAGIRGAVNSLGSLYGQGFSVGASLGQGVAAGLYSQVGAVAAAAAALVNAASAAAQARGQIASPSKLMRDEIGIPLAQGVMVGMESQRDAVARTFASMIPVNANLGRGYRGSVSSPYAARGSAGGPVVQNVTIYTLKADEYQRLLKQAQNGDRAYQQQQPRSRDRQLGSTR